MTRFTSNEFTSYLKLVDSISRYSAIAEIFRVMRQRKRAAILKEKDINVKFWHLLWKLETTSWFSFKYIV